MKIWPVSGYWRGLQQAAQPDPVYWSMLIESKFPGFEKIVFRKDTRKSRTILN